MISLSSIHFAILLCCSSIEIFFCLFFFFFFFFFFQLRTKKMTVEVSTKIVEG